ncbi:hypothetical protein PTSG_11117 [Salpingoeca rosetta]|uniref:Uncharacterized protein n=1 Tax=Salpingoeca rosetta (strain ATCC 50818 / BSB-021) TaxID=946362 RepID=F2US70_SALR5|nr:uncharacterized protein PTSG_11117 [Salpingoeca rosetta]EGD80475.1 hypothetical protein PTSG_11117 [Salpingoeca rosetta]|eukprot:XP_004988039.1 hypothetical protein PTSG_11117 [Salpingoeca rosetta]
MPSSTLRDDRHSKVNTSTTTTMTTTPTSTMRRSTAVTLQVTTPEYEPVISRILLLIWTFLLVVTWILLVVAFTLPDWVEGTEPTDDPDFPFLDRQVGLFRQCEQYTPLNDNVVTGFGAERCFSTGFNKSNIDAWYAAGVLFVIGVIFLSMTIVLALVATIRANGWVAALAKLSMSITSIFFLIASILFPLGFIYLDDRCPAGTEEGQCGLRCTDPTAGMDYFTLCGPYGVGAASFLMFAALVVFFISSFCAACVRSA